jgi:hypothetical protein
VCKECQNQPVTIVVLGVERNPELPYLVVVKEYQINWQEMKNDVSYF